MNATVNFQIKLVTYGNEPTVRIEKATGEPFVPCYFRDMYQENGQEKVDYYGIHIDPALFFAAPERAFPVKEGQAAVGGKCREFSITVTGPVDETLKPGKLVIETRAFTRKTGEKAVLKQSTRHISAANGYALDIFPIMRDAENKAHRVALENVPATMTAAPEAQMSETQM